MYIILETNSFKNHRSQVGAQENKELVISYYSTFSIPFQPSLAIFDHISLSTSFSDKTWRKFLVIGLKQEFASYAKASIKFGKRLCEEEVETLFARNLRITFHLVILLKFPNENSELTT